jgi:hypothetical protein
MPVETIRSRELELQAVVSHPVLGTRNWTGPSLQPLGNGLVLVVRINSMYDVKQCIIVSLSPLKTLEEEFARKLQEQEVFFKMTGESECLNPSAQSRISKFYPIPTLHSTGS